MIKVRFAPSPTGYLHVGNVRTALVNWLFARHARGEFLLRFDDTDAERSKPEYETAIREDLSWLGLAWDQEARQTDRMASYAAAAEKLKSLGRLYACYETTEELEIKRKMAAARGKPPIYDRAGLKLTDAEKQKYASEGRKPHWRFLLKEEPIAWKDMIRGETRFHGSHLTDPVLIREDGIPLFTFASVVDEEDMQITHVIRGEDHVSNTAVQIQIFEALGYALPQFGHLALIKLKDGELSKRVGGGDIRGLRARGFEPLSICSLLARMGTSEAIEALPSMQALIEQFDLSTYGRSIAMYDEEELLRLNAKHVPTLSFEEVKTRLPQGADEEFWRSVRANVSHVSDADAWWKLIHTPVTPVIEDLAFTTEAARVLPASEWDANTWNQWIDAVKTATGRKGKELFMPLRLALTGRADGPELKHIFTWIGREKAAKRLKGETA